MKEALKQHPVSGTSVSVNVIDKSRESLEVNKLDNFGAFHNFHFESSGMESLWYWFRKAFSVLSAVCEASGSNYASNGG
jgi:hypothetical protein